MEPRKDYRKLLENWPSSYYHLEEPMERKALLDLAIESEIDPVGNEIRLLLWNRRYPKGEKLAAKGKMVLDMFVRTWMLLDVTSGRLNSRFRHKKLLKDTKKQLEFLGLDVIETYGKKGIRILYEEMYQLVYYYMKLCAEDRTYGTIILGLGKLNQELYAKKVAENIYRVCYKVPDVLGLQNEFAILQMAAQDAYSEMFPKYLEIYEEVQEKGVK